MEMEMALEAEGCNWGQANGRQFETFFIWLAASAPEPPFLPRNRRTFPSTQLTMEKPQVLLLFFFLFLVSLWVVCWLFGCLAGWSNSTLKYFLGFSSFLFYFRSLKVNLERSRK